MLKIVGAGLPRTGTASLARALEMLGYRTLHHSPERLDLDNLSHDAIVHAYDDVEAVVDAPACAFWRQLVYGHDAKVLFTIRNEEQWWESIKWHHNRIMVSADARHARYTRRLHAMLFGSEHPQEYLWRERYNEHRHAVIGECERSGWAYLVMNICDGGDKWDALCPFLGVPQPKVEFPWQNKKE